MANSEIRCALIVKGVKQYRVAEKLGMWDSTLSRKLRKELPPEEKKRILDAIEELAKEVC